MSEFGPVPDHITQGDNLFVQETRAVRPVKSQYWPVNFFELTFPRKELGKLTSVHSNELDEASNLGDYSEPEATHVHPSFPSNPEINMSKSEDRLKCPNATQAEESSSGFEYAKLQFQLVPTSLLSQSAIANP
jgi:hypothetical protein